MKNIKSCIAVYGDPHLSSKNYGAHRDYPRESLDYFGQLVDIIKRRQCNCVIGAGDFSYGRFISLEYRDAIDKLLTEIHTVTQGNHYMLLGNHDIAGYGLVERDYYISKGLLKSSENLTIDNLNITMVDFDKHLETVPNIVDSEDSYNIIIAHDFFKFKDTTVANYGKAIELDNYELWFGADCLICGHVHKIMEFEGNIVKNGLEHKLKVHYPGCMMRPSYREGHMDNVGQVIILTLYDDGTLDYTVEEIKLWELGESFNLELKESERVKKEEKASRVDISDIVKQLDAHDRDIGNPEDIIDNLEGINELYKNKAKELLKKAME